MYDFPPFRPPNEAASALIRITHGCPWNRCAFCSMYKPIKFKTKPVEKIKNDVRMAREIYGSAHSIFLGDSDNLVDNHLPEILRFIKKTFPEAERITSYARAKTILSRKTEYLFAVREAGLNRLHIGLESGNAAVLDWLNKGATPEEMIQAGIKAKQIGFEVSFYIISGAGGIEKWKEHALNSASVLNAVNPDFIRLRTLTVQHGTPLAEKLVKGDFVITPPLERLKEVRLFLETLDLENCYLASDHLTNYLWAENMIIYREVEGSLPDDKQKMIETVAQVIALIESTGIEVKDSNQLYRKGIINTL